MSKQQKPYILWLPSWYPNKSEPYSGDFIQRHAKAAALYDPVTVIFFTQFGEKVSQDYHIETTVNGNLTEIIVYIPFVPLKIRFLDRVRYNFKYYSFAKNFLKNYLKKFGPPHIVHVHVPMKAGNLALWIKQKFKTPFIVSEQASTYLKEAPDNFFNRHWLYRLQVKKIFEAADYVTNVSAAVGEILKNLFNIKRFTVIHNTVDTTIFKYSPGKNNVFTYIHVSSLTDQKNIFGILHVFERLSKIRTDWKLIVVGPYTTEIKQFIERENLKGFIFLTGEVPYKEVAKYMQQAHAMVLFSKHENFPCVVVEALCCGLPVISSDVAGVKEAVNASNGILVKSGDKEQLLEEVIRTRDKYPDYHMLQISSDAVSKYNYRAIGEKFHKLYSTVVE